MATSNPANVTTSSYEAQNPRYENFENVPTIEELRRANELPEIPTDAGNNVCAFTSSTVKSNQLNLYVWSSSFLCVISLSVFFFFFLIIFSCMIRLLKEQTVYYIRVCSFRIINPFPSLVFNKHWLLQYVMSLEALCIICAYY